MFLRLPQNERVISKKISYPTGIYFGSIFKLVIIAPNFDG